MTKNGTQEVHVAKEPVVQKRTATEKPEEDGAAVTGKPENHHAADAREADDKLPFMNMRPIIEDDEESEVSNKSPTVIDDTFMYDLRRSTTRSSRRRRSRRSCGRKIITNILEPCWKRRR